MPLLNGKSRGVHSANVAELVKSGYPVAQANAIAYSHSRGKKHDGKKNPPKRSKS
jgi:hypothetical protein